MEITRIRMLRGPNLWSRHTALEAIVSCEEHERAMDAIPQFETKIRERFPQLGSMHRGGHAESLSLAHALEHAALGLQSQAGCPVTFSRTVPAIDAGIFQVIVEYSEEVVGRMAFDFAFALIQSTLNDAPFDLAAALSELEALYEDVRLGPSTGSIVDAAVQRNIPYRRMTEGSMVQFGWGSKQKRIQAAETSDTSAIAEAIAQDKELTKNLLAAAGVSVPIGDVVTTADEAWLAAQRIGGAIVLKPKDGNQGKGVVANIQTEAEVRAGFVVTQAFGRETIVERFLPGADYRLLVVGNRLAAAARREPAQVVGDGTHSIAELVELENKNPLRGDGHATALTKIRFDEIALAHLASLNFTPQYMPKIGERILLRNNANLSTGGTATDVTDDVHPDVAASAVAAAKMIGLDVAGVDILCESIYQPLEAQGGGIVEVNAAPGLRMHLKPSYGKSRPVGEDIINMMYPLGEDGRIPVVAVTGTNGKTTTVRLIAHLLSETGLRVGMTTTDGVYINQRLIDSGDCSGPKSARNVLMHPDTDAAVLETARGGLLREGLGFDRCEVAVVTNIGVGDHLGLNFISSVEDLAILKRVIVQNVAPSGAAVLNAADPIVAKMADVCTGRVIFFAQNQHHPVVAAHRAKNKKVIYCDGTHIIASKGARVLYRFPVSEIPFTQNGVLGFQVENAMAAIGAAWALGLDAEKIARGLHSFESSATAVPGRFNQFQHKGATVIADYGHNPDAMRALASAIEAMKPKQSHVVISGAGDRRDEDIRDLTRILGNAFDHVILYEDQCQRGRETGEVLKLLREGLVGTTKTKQVKEIYGEFLAIDTALDSLSEGDICLILIDQVEESLAYLKEKVQP
ncbi:cyanophycin synthetase [Polynucleobacter meluiroseus]|uniref:Cyanophycin synthetase n=1 Tax=Polynucleobacter meluiroseus TaxID=1938814 RepID=A0A240E2Y0_9BURK|nr:cyanophycin synthetase [Polynucleobacter meluiroseus]SNX29284.1 cyanophycin synthetase [Polynucleobacter meluiroseus]